jgi:heme/copper-type cytochrome/quinol oxidase subunit 4
VVATIETSEQANRGASLPDYIDDATDIALSLVTSSEATGQSSQVALDIGAAWSPPYIRDIVYTKLNFITCDGETILITLPIDHRIGTDVEAGTLGVTILGACAIFLILCFLYFFHLRTAIKASSPFFLLATVFGMLFLFTAGIPSARLPTLAALLIEYV